MQTARWFPWSGLFALGLVVAGALPVRADLLDDVKARGAVDAQRTEKLISDFQVAAMKLEKTRPSEALDNIRAAMATLELNQSLEPKRRESLLRYLRGWSEKLEARVGAAKTGTTPDLPRFGPADLKRAQADKEQSEADYIRRMNDSIRAARQSGDYRAASQYQDELSRKFPGNPAVTAGRTINSVASAVGDREELRRMRNEGMLRVGADIERSAMIPVRDVTFPADWQEKSKRRSNAVLMTQKERAIMNALNTVISVEFSNNTFEEVINYLQKVTGQPIIVDKLALGDAGVTYETPVTCKVRASTRSVLRKILGDVNLTYIVKDEAIQVTSIARAQATLSIRQYYIGDLLAVTGGNFNPYVAQAQQALQIQQLAVLITQTIDPPSWAVNGQGGLGTIMYNPIGMTFVIKQTAEFHYLFGASMR